MFGQVLETAAGAVAVEWSRFAGGAPHMAVKFP
jgi:hypothetical protein